MDDINSFLLDKKFYQNFHNNIIETHIKQKGFNNYVVEKENKLTNIIKLAYIVYQVSKQKKKRRGR